MRPSARPLGENAITLTFGEGIDEELNDTVIAAAAAIGEARLPGVVEVVPSYASLAVFFDAVSAAHDELVLSLHEIVGTPRKQRTGASGRLHSVPVSYDGEDLDVVAERCGLSRDEVIAIHSGTEYRVFVLGFVPGFAYLGRLDDRLSLPRRAEPRTRVPAGSVAIAERQTAVYPLDTPGGWHLLGHTVEKFFDPSRDEPALLRVGDRVKFVPC